MRTAIRVFYLCGLVASARSRPDLGGLFGASPRGPAAGACPGGSPAPSDGMRVRLLFSRKRGLAGTFARPGGTAAWLEETGAPRERSSCVLRLQSQNLSFRPSRPGRRLAGSGRGGARRSRLAPPRPETIATWLILPVVICLSQRLSHACLSMRGLNTLKLRMAHYISNNFFDGPLATRIPVENLELIRARRPDPREGLQLLDTRPTAFGDPR